MSPPAATNCPFLFRPGARDTRIVQERGAVILEVPMPWLAGPRTETFASGRIAEQSNDFILAVREGTLTGVAVAPEGLDPRSAARHLYGKVLEALDGRPLYRVWNYVPSINAQTNGIENYRAFNAGRHEAFSAAYGADFADRLPAASALGTNGGRLALAFLAGTAAPRHFENPEQVPAFQYPPEHGPVPPSFARGTCVEDLMGQAWYLSGTASIKGHATCGAGFPEQAQLTFDNVRLMFDRMGLPPETAGSWKIFLRQPGDLTACQELFAAAFPHALNSAMFLQAEVCRQSLLLEIEATCQLPAAPPTRTDTAASAVPAL